MRVGGPYGTDLRRGARAVFAAAVLAVSRWRARARPEKREFGGRLLRSPTRARTMFPPKVRTCMSCHALPKACHALADGSLAPPKLGNTWLWRGAPGRKRTPFPPPPEFRYNAGHRAGAAGVAAAGARAFRGRANCGHTTPPLIKRQGVLVKLRVGGPYGTDLRRGARAVFAAAVLAVSRWRTRARPEKRKFGGRLLRSPTRAGTMFPPKVRTCMPCHALGAMRASGPEPPRKRTGLAPKQIRGPAGAKRPPFPTGAARRRCYSHAIVETRRPGGRAAAKYYT